MNEKFLERLLTDNKCGLGTLYKHCLIISPKALLTSINEFIPYQTATLETASNNKVVLNLDFGCFVVKAKFCGNFENGKGKINDVSLSI